jgi:manganese-dependent inorganic pyrophosphatase
MNQDELEAIKEKLVPYMQKAMKDHSVEMLFFMLTNIMESSTELLYQGNDAKELLVNAFKLNPNEEMIYLKGVVSRKKQLIPALMITLQQDNG